MQSFSQLEIMNHKINKPAGRIPYQKRNLLETGSGKENSAIVEIELHEMDSAISHIKLHCNIPYSQ